MSRDIRAGGAFVEFFSKGKVGVMRDLQTVQTSLRAFGTATAAISGAIAAGLGAAFAKFSSMGDSLTDTANRLGITTERLQELSYAASQSGASMADVERAMLMAQRKGLNFEKVAAAIGAMEDPVRRNQAAFEAFGKSGAKIAPMLKELSQLSTKARELGLVFKPEDVAAGGRMADMWGAIKDQVAAVAFHVGAALAPAMETLFGVTQQVLAVTIRFVDQNRALVIGAALSSIALGAMAGGFLGVAAAAWIATTAMTAYSTIAAVAAGITAVIVSPVAIIVGLLAALGAELVAAAAYWAFYTEQGQRAMKFLWNVVSTTLKGIGDAIMSGNLKLAWEIALAGVFVVFAKFQEKLTAAWEAMKTRIIASTIDMAKVINESLPAFLKIQGMDVVGNALNGQRQQAEKNANAQAGALANAAQFALDALAAKAGKEKERAFPEMPGLPKFQGAGQFGAGSQSGQFGSFNAAIAAMAGRTGQLTVEQKQLDALEEMKDDMAIIRKKAEEGGLVFG